MRKRLIIMRRTRGPRFGFEWHNYSGVRFLHISITSPKRHAWWAIQVWIYTSFRNHRWSILSYIPSKVINIF